MFNVKNFFEFLYPRDEVVGIDIGSYSLKFVLFSKKKNGEVVLKNWGYQPLILPQDLNPDEKRIAIASEISSFIKKNQIKTKYAATSVSGNSVIVRYIKIPQIEPKLFSEGIYTQAEAFIPFDINDVYLSYYVINPSIFDENQNKMEVVLVAAKKEIIDERLNIIKEAGLMPVLIDVDSFAIENIINRIEPEPEIEGSAVMVINIGHNVTNLSILSDNISLVNQSYYGKKEYYSRLVRDIFVGGSSINKNIAKRFSFKDDESQEFKKALKILVSDEDKLSAIEDYNRNLILGSKIISSVFKEIVSDITRSIDFLTSSVLDINITKAYICGGSSSFDGADEMISSQLKIPVKRIDPFSFVSNPPKNLPDYIKNSLCVAAGLSLRSIKTL